MLTNHFRSELFDDSDTTDYSQCQIGKQNLLLHVFLILLLILNKQNDSQMYNNSDSEWLNG
jgi:hypothetical protein